MLIRSEIYFFHLDFRLLDLRLLRILDFSPIVIPSEVEGLEFGISTDYHLHTILQTTILFPEV